jgi:hypothetical protein
MFTLYLYARRQTEWQRIVPSMLNRIASLVELNLRSSVIPNRTQSYN